MSDSKSGLNTISDILSLINSLSEGEVLIIDRNTIKRGETFKGKNGVWKESGKICNTFESTEPLSCIGSTSLAKSPKSNPIKSFSQFGDESAYKAKKRRLHREQIEIKKQEFLVGLALESWADTQPKKYSRTYQNGHWYKIHVCSDGTKIYYEVYPEGHVDAGKCKTGKIEFIRFPDGTSKRITLEAGTLMMDGIRI